jgi:hypothetical protein
MPKTHTYEITIKLRVGNVPAYAIEREQDIRILEVEDLAALDAKVASALDEFWLTPRRVDIGDERFTPDGKRIFGDGSSFEVLVYHVDKTEAPVSDDDRIVL